MLELQGKKRAKAVRGAHFQNYSPPGKDLLAPGPSASAAVGFAPQGIISTQQTQHPCNLAADFGKGRVFTAGFAISCQNTQALG